MNDELAIEATDLVKTFSTRAGTTQALDGQHAAVDEELTGRENLRMFGRLYHLGERRARSRSEELLVQFGLENAADRLVRTYSGGMRRRLDLAASLLIAPEVLFLDEADHLADDIAVIDHGRVIATGTPSALKQQIGGDRVDIVLADPRTGSRAAEAVRRATGADALVSADGSRVSAPAPRGGAVLAGIVRELDRMGIAAADLALRQPTLDDVFLQLTGQAPEKEKVA